MQLLAKAKAGPVVTVLQEVDTKPGAVAVTGVQVPASTVAEVRGTLVQAIVT